MIKGNNYLLVLVFQIIIEGCGQMVIMFGSGIGACGIHEVFEVLAQSKYTIHMYIYTIQLFRCVSKVISIGHIFNIGTSVKSTNINIGIGIGIFLISV